MNNFIDLVRDDLSGSESMLSSIERMHDGVSRVDMLNFEKFFDGVLMNAFKIMSESRKINSPKQFTKEEWYDKIDSVYKKCCMICENHKLLDRNNNLSSDFENNLKAENYAFRSEVLEFIKDYLEDVYIYD